MTPSRNFARWIASWLVTSSALALLACGGGSAPSSPAFPPLRDPTPGVPQVLSSPAVWATATPHPTFTPIPTPWPTLGFALPLAPTPVPPTPTVDPSRPVLPAGIIRPTAAPRRLDCTVHFRAWLVQSGRLTGAAAVHAQLRAFRAVRPDCVFAKFDPVFSDGAICADEDRVAGLRVSGPLSLGDAYNRNLRLSSTRSDSRGNILLHFHRFPLGPGGGCWYYHAVSGVWHEQDASPSVSGPSPGALSGTPAPTPLPAEYRDCDDELRDLLVRSVYLPGPLSVGDLVLRVQTGLRQCSMSWLPVSSPDRLDPVCPARLSGVGPGGVFLVHWSSPPHDGASCWQYDPAHASWSSW